MPQPPPKPKPSVYTLRLMVKSNPNLEIVKTAWASRRMT